MSEISNVYPYFQAAPFDLRRSFDSYMADKVRNFVGRQFVFDAINDFLKNNSSGYYIIRGDPGIGKTALLAKLILDKGYIHHFNIALQNIRSVRSFLENVSSQLISRYNLPYKSLPQNATDDSGFLMQCLSDVAAKRENHPIVIAVDAIDEADRTGMAASVNSLYLPVSLPEGVYIIITVRRIYDPRLQFSKSQILDLEANSAGKVSPHLSVGGDAKRLAKNGVHWQTQRTSTSLRKANEPTRYILPEYGLPRKGSN